MRIGAGRAPATGTQQFGLEACGETLVGHGWGDPFQSVVLRIGIRVPPQRAPQPSAAARPAWALEFW